MSKKINQFTVATNTDVADSNKLWAMGDAATGLLLKATGTQVKATLQTFKKKYAATGSEGTVLTISELAGKEILSIIREGSGLYEVTSSPDSLEFIWNGTTITLGLGVQNAGERFLILYKTI